MDASTKKVLDKVPLWLVLCLVVIEALCVAYEWVARAVRRLRPEWALKDRLMQNMIRRSTDTWNETN